MLKKHFTWHTGMEDFENALAFVRDNMKPFDYKIVNAYKSRYSSERNAASMPAHISFGDKEWCFTTEEYYMEAEKA